MFVSRVRLQPTFARQEFGEQHMSGEGLGSGAKLENSPHTQEASNLSAETRL